MQNKAILIILFSLRIALFAVGQNPLFTTTKIMLFRYILKRILIFLPTIFIISVAVFMLNHYAPNDPANVVLNSTGSQGSRSYKDEEKILEELRKKFNLDLPPFYFSFTSAAYPDTLYRIQKKDHRYTLNRLIDAYGNWENVQAYYYSLKQFKIALSETPKDSSNANPLIGLNRQVNGLFIKYSEAEVQALLKEIPNYISLEFNTAHLRPSFDNLTVAYQNMVNQPTLWKKYIPRLNWFGRKNQYHIWIFGETPWFPNNTTVLEASASPVTPNWKTVEFDAQKGGYYQFIPEFQIIENQGLRNEVALQKTAFFKLEIDSLQRPYSLEKIAASPIIYYHKSDSKKATIRYSVLPTIKDVKFEASPAVLHLKDYDPTETSAGILRLDFGRSYTNKEPVVEKIGGAIYWTVIISLISILLTYFIAIPLGVYSARKKDTATDGAITTLLFILYSLPNFWIASLLIVFLAQPAYFNLFPSFGLGTVTDDMTLFEVFQLRAYHLILPLFCWTYPSLAFLSRQMRGGMLANLNQDFVRTARAKGVSENTVIWKHAFRNSLLPIITLFANVFPRMISGSIVIEVIFSIPGMGKVLLDAISTGDFPTMSSIVLLAAFLTMIGYLVADILYRLIDPRITYQ